MAFCAKCGAALTDGEKFCASCGNPVEQPAQQAAPQQAAPQQGNFADTVKNLNNTPDSTSAFDPTDIANNKGMAVLAYLGPLWFIPKFASKASPYAQYHCGQGFNVLLLWAADIILSILLGLIKVPHTNAYWGYTYYSSPWWVTLITWLISLAVSILAIIGIINAAKGQAKELPLIGKIKILK